jgi:hypothetical protein
VSCQYCDFARNWKSFFQPETIGVSFNGYATFSQSNAKRWTPKSWAGRQIVPALCLGTESLKQSKNCWWGHKAHHTRQGNGRTSMLEPLAERGGCCIDGWKELHWQNKMNLYVTSRLDLMLWIWDLMSRIKGWGRAMVWAFGPGHEVLCLVLAVVDSVGTAVQVYLIRWDIKPWIGIIAHIAVQFKGVQMSWHTRSQLLHPWIVAKLNGP